MSVRQLAFAAPLLLLASSMASAGTWGTFTSFTGDATSGVSPGTYTAAVDVGGSGETINGVLFAAGSTSGSNYSFNSHWSGSVTDSLADVSGSVASLLNNSIKTDHSFGFFNSTLTLSGLTLGTDYVATFYFPGTTASDTFHAGNDAFVMPGNLDTSVGYYETYAYTASGNTQDFTFIFNGPDGVRLAGFSNRQGQVIVTPPGDPTWNVNSSGDWNTSGNWANGLPNGVDAKAVFGTAISAPQLIYTRSGVTLGTLTFDNANSYTLAGAYPAGTLTMSVSSGQATIQVNQGTHDINLPVSFGSDTTINVAASSTLIISDPVTLNGHTVTKTGPGTLTLNVNFQVAGGSMSATAGTLGIGSQAIVSPSVLSVGGGALLTGDGTISGANVSYTSSAASTFSGSITGSASTLTVDAGSGSLTLTGPSSYGGGTIINSGALSVANATGSATGAGPVALNGGMLASGVTGTISGAVTAGGASQTIAPGGLGAIGTLALGSTLSLNSHSTLAFDLTGSSDDLLAVGGALSVTGGQATLALSASGVLPAQVTLATFATSSLSLSNFAVTGMPDGYSLLVEPNDLKLISGPPPGNGVWTNGVGDYKWSNSNNWQTAQPIGAGLTATFNATGQGATSSPVLLNGGKTIGKLVLDTPSGGYTIGAGAADGVLTFDNTGGSGSAAITVSSGSHVVAAPIANPNALLVTVASDPSASSPALTISSGITGLGALSKGGPGTLLLTAASNYGGGTTVTGGVLKTTVNNGIGSGALAASGAVILGGDQHLGNLSGSNTGSVSLAASKTLTVNQTTADTLAGGLSLGAGATLAKTGPATLTLSGVTSLADNSVVNVSSGALKLSVAPGSSIGSGVNVNVTGSATLQLAGTTSALAAASVADHRATITNDSSSAAGVDALSGVQQVGGIDGLGSVTVEAGADLTADHINQSLLVIGAGSTFHLAPSNASGAPLTTSGAGLTSLKPTSAFFTTRFGVATPTSGATTSQTATLGGGAVSPVPEPATITLLCVGVLAIAAAGRRATRRIR